LVFFVVAFVLLVLFGECFGLFWFAGMVFVLLGFVFIVFFVVVGCKVGFWIE